MVVYIGDYWTGAILVAGQQKEQSAAIREESNGFFLKSHVRAMLEFWWVERGLLIVASLRLCALELPRCV